MKSKKYPIVEKCLIKFTKYSLWIDRYNILVSTHTKEPKHKYFMTLGHSLEWLQGKVEESEFIEKLLTLSNEVSLEKIKNMSKDELFKELCLKKKRG